MIVLDTPERRKIVASEDYKDIFCCIRCAACLNVCPAFRLVGGHVYGGSIYTGGIGTLLTSFLNSRERGKDIQNICLQCGTCNTVCGGKLDIAGMIANYVRNSLRKMASIRSINSVSIRLLTVTSSTLCCASLPLLRA